MDTKDALTHLHKLLRESRLDQAETFLREALADMARDGDLDGEKVLLNEQIGFFRDCGKFPEALEAAARARTLFEDAGETDSIAYATTLLNCANAYRAAGVWEKAEETYETVLEMFSQLLTEEYDLYASYWNNLALLYQDTARWEDARAALKRALSYAEKEGDEIKIAISNSNLAATLLQLKDLPAALSCLKRAKEILSNRSPSDFHYSSVLSGFGDYWALKNRPEKAAAYYEAALSEIALHMGHCPFYEMTLEKALDCYPGRARAEKTAVALAREYYETFAKEPLQTLMPALFQKIAVGIICEGSEYLGFDDAVSRDHDFGPGFCIWAPKDVSEEDFAALRLFYERLPREYYGLERRSSKEGRGRLGVWRLQDFFLEYFGTPHPPRTLGNWLGADSHRLLLFAKGSVFHDPANLLNDARRMVAAGYPFGARLRLCAQELGVLAQAGQYNYQRCLRRGDVATAHCYEMRFCIHALRAWLLLEDIYPPYEKWLLRAMDWCSLPGAGIVRAYVQKLMERADLDGNMNAVTDMMTEICKMIEEAFAMTMQTKPAADHFLADTAEQLAQRAENETLAENMARLEFETFDSVQNIGGRAECQDNWETFRIMRVSQYFYWPADLMRAWYDYFQACAESGRNLITEKYAYMMESTDPKRFAAMRDKLPVLPEDFKKLRDAIVEIQVGWMEDFAKRYPALAAHARRIRTALDSAEETSYETYLRGELSVYPPAVLYGYGRWIVELNQKGWNLAEKTMELTVRAYGYRDLTEAERKMAEKG